MSKCNVYNVEMKQVGEIELSESVFGASVKPFLLHEAIKVERANKRLGCASTKTRGEVKCSNVKPYRQKGTGRARHGTYASPLFVGGGIVFGPRPRDFGLKMNKKTKHMAVKNALAAKAQENRFLVIDKWQETKKTKEMAAVLKKMKIKNALIVLDEPTEWLERTVRNIPYIRTTYASRLNVYNLLAHEYVVCTKDVVAKIEERFKQ